MVAELLEAGVIKKSNNPFSSPIVMAVEDHELHLGTVLAVLRQHKFYAKKSKCVFGTEKVEYLGHVISIMGMATNLEKMSTLAHLKCLPRLMGFNYEIQYKKGVENVIDDALSRLEHSSKLFSMISSSLATDIYQRIVVSWQTYVKLKQVIEKLQQDQAVKRFAATFALPTTIWSNVSMDFVESLPKSQGKTVSFVIVDRAQDRMKSQADKRITYKEYAMGDWVYMKVQPHREITIKKGNKNKLSPNYYGPFQVQDRLGQAVTKPENWIAMGNFLTIATKR
ncbi:hypothetical protein Tco_0126942 [Tanacetum coccineum]